MKKSETDTDREYFIKMLREGKMERLAECFDSSRPVLFYGCGNQGMVCEEIFADCMKFDVKGFLVSDAYFERQRSYKSMPVYSVSANPFKKDECNILLTMGSDAAQAVEKELIESGYTHVYHIGDWNNYNILLREYVLWHIFKKHHVQFQKTDSIFTHGTFRFLNPYKEKSNYLSMFLGEFNSLVAPHVLGEYGFIQLEGPYEYKDVKPQSGDVVIDCGANIGLFSAAAASLGCKVYAFEPVQFIADYLQRTADLYEDKQIEVIRKALSDSVGTAEFTQVDEDFHVLGWSTAVLAGERNTTLPTTTIDAFVEEMQLSRVDFIKADIEGAERDMLCGAANTLRTFAPKLAVCTYHLPDDAEVLKNIILEANPDYVIEYQWEKLFAYVPKEDRDV